MTGDKYLESDVAKSSTDSPFSRHSTLLGFAAASVVVTLLGWLTKWRDPFMVYTIVGVASVWFFSRVFYGFHSATRLDKADTAKNSVGMADALYGLPIRWDGRKAENLSLAYEKWRVGDPSAFERIAEEEQHQQNDESAGIAENC